MVALFPVEPRVRRVVRWRRPRTALMLMCDLHRFARLCVHVTYRLKHKLSRHGVVLQDLKAGSTAACRTMDDMVDNVGCLWRGEWGGGACFDAKFIVEKSFRKRTATGWGRHTQEQGKFPNSDTESERMPPGTECQTSTPPAHLTEVWIATPLSCITCRTFSVTRAVTTCTHAHAVRLCQRA